MMAVVVGHFVSFDSVWGTTVSAALPLSFILAALAHSMSVEAREQGGGPLRLELGVVGGELEADADVVLHSADLA